MPQWLLNLGRSLIANDTTRAYIFAYARHGLGILGAWLVTKGWASNSMVEDATGLILAAVAFYGAHKDVSGVSSTVTTIKASTASTAAVAKALADAPKTDPAVDARLDAGTL